MLTVTEILRRTGVVGKFVEYFGPGLSSLTIADRRRSRTCRRSTARFCGFWPVDEQTIEYLRPDRPHGGAIAARRGLLQGKHALARAGRASALLAGGRARPGHRGAEHRRPAEAAGPRAALGCEKSLAAAFGFDVEYGNGSYDKEVADSFPASDPLTREATATPTRPSCTGCRRAAGSRGGAGSYGRRGGAARQRQRRHRRDHELHEHLEPAGADHGGAAREERRRARPATEAWVKSSLAPGSRVVTRYLDHAGLTTYLEQLGFHTVGYGCTTCIGNSGPWPSRSRRPFRGRSRRRLGSLRQPQLRGADPSRREGELSGLAAARHRICARWPDGPRPDDRAAGRSADGATCT